MRTRVSGAPMVVPKWPVDVCSFPAPQTLEAQQVVLSPQGKGRGSAIPLQERAELRIASNVLFAEEDPRFLVLTIYS